MQTDFKRVFHCDDGRIFKHEDTPEGFLRLWMTVSRVGPLTYFNTDGSKRVEHVPRDTLFDPISLDSAWGKPITDGHPIDRRVGANNAVKFQRGMSQQGMVVNGDFLTIVGVLTDADTIAKVKSGEATKVSAGYDTKIRPRADGTYEQYDRVYNHFAICQNPRAGDEARVHLDSADDVGAVWRADAIDEDIDMKYQRYDDEDEVLEGEEFEGDDDYIIVEYDGTQYAVAPSLAEAIQIEQERTDEITGAYNDLYAEKTRLDGELAAVQVRLDEVQEDDWTEEDEAELQAAIAQEVEDRLDCWARTIDFHRADNVDYQPDFSMSVPEIQLEFLRALQKKHPTRINLDAIDEALRTDEVDEGSLIAHIDGYYRGLIPMASSPGGRSEQNNQRTDDLFSRLNATSGKSDGDQPNTIFSSYRDRNDNLTDTERARKARLEQIADNYKTDRN